jgi:hypothetical protein
MLWKGKENEVEEVINKRKTKSEERNSKLANHPITRWPDQKGSHE